ncbi:MAG: phosphatidylglycerophosphatase A [Deltaproteobacteria bacterium]|jgi:phosphatidylglycerophosphatase A|nr:phosphatidylglycerophosphatase A [Deltaproteobacteria bacterium]
MTEKESLLNRAAPHVWSLAGLGRLKGVPGWYASIAAVPIYFILLWLGWKPYLAVWLALFFLSWYLSVLAERLYGHHNDPRVVIDDFLGYLTTMFLAPKFIYLPLAFLWGLAYYRLIIFFKPAFIGRLSKNEGGLYVVLDDIAAGLAATFLMWLTAAVVFVIKNPFGPEIFSQ